MLKSQKNLDQQNKTIFFLLLSFFIIFFYQNTVQAEGILYSYPADKSHSPLFKEVRYSSLLIKKHPDIFDISPGLFKDTAIIDFEKRQITFKTYDTYSGIVLWEYHYPEFDEYLNSMYYHSLYSFWNEYGQKEDEKDKKKKKAPTLEFTMPDFYPAWARRVLGKEPPKLSIKGFQSITLGIKSRKQQVGEKSGGNSGVEESPGRPRFDFNHDNMFTIRGSIGRLLTIELKAGKNKEDNEFNFKNQLEKLKIHYKADPDSANQLEDEIIQEIIIGKTNFQMPGQGLAGFSGSREGLFGIKVQAQIGPLALTTIMSREHSETQKTVLNPSGQSGEIVIYENSYIRNTYFFLDSVYLNKYIGKPASVPAPEVTDLKVFRYIPSSQYDKNNPQDYVQAKYGDFIDGNELSWFQILKEHDDYYLDKRNGWIRFHSNRPSGSDIICIYLRTTDEGQGSIEKGKMSQYSNTVFDNLWVLKNSYPENTYPSDSTYYLMWRNVYSLPQDAKPDDFNIDVFRIVNEKREAYKTNDSLYSFILGITNKNNEEDVGNQQIFDFTEKHLIIPPCHFIDSTGNLHYSNHPFENPALGQLANGESNMNPNIYIDSISTQTSKYQIVTTGTSRKTTFNIGWGIIPGTVELVNENGKKLIKDEDYRIEYDFGQITLISPEAKSAQKITVDYQQESPFLFDTRTFLGAYGKLDLPNIGRESYFATTVMGQFTVSKDKIPRVGYEPFNRFLFDSNLHFDFEPEWMTKIMNFIPLFSSTSTSSATFDFEIAYSYLSPDKKQGGKAYIDNFQSAERGYPLGESHSLWYKSSPSDEVTKNDSTFAYNPPAWKSYWYQPVKGDNRTRRTQIWEIEKGISDPEEYLTTLRLVCQPLPADPALLAGIKDSSDSILVNPWCGIMTPIPGSLQDRKKDRYFQFWIKNSQDNNNPNNVRNTGVLYIDFGDISEDISINGHLPNQKANYEFKKTNDYKQIYDIGLDSLPDESEFYCYPVITGNTISFDSLFHGDIKLGEFSSDPSRDNYKTYDNDNLNNRSKVNGTQKNIYMNSEDINGDGFRWYNNYFRVKIDFSTISTSNLLDTARITDSARVYGWYPIRIPVNTQNDSLYIHSKTGKPKWDRVKYVRFIWTDFKKKEYLTQDSRLEFTDMKFTGNQWQEIAIKDTSDAIIISTVLNSIDDKGFYFRPRGIDSLDSENKPKKDFALRLEYENIRGGDVALVKKDIPGFQKIDLSSYKEIQMFIRDTLSAIYSSEPKTENIINNINLIDKEKDLIQFVFRFGNNDSSYYEFRTSNLKNHWSKGHDIRIDLTKLSDMKQAYQNRYGLRLDSIHITDTLPDGKSTLSIFSRTGILPVFSNIQWIALGVARNERAQYLADGEVWIHGLRVAGIEAVDGWAFRANMNTHWADFMDVSANFSYDDADFRQMSAEPLAAKNAKIQAGISAHWSVNKFLPEKWGISIPLGTGISASVSRPKIKPGSDIFLTQNDGKTDRFSDMAKDFADLIFNSSLSEKKTEAEHYETNNINKTWFTKYSKNTNSENPVTNFTADRITSEYSYARDSTTKFEGTIPNEDKPKIKRKYIGEDHIDVTSTQTHTSSLKYDLSPRNPPDWTSWTPLSKIKSKNVPRYIKDYKFDILPSRINFDLISGTFIKQYTYRSLKDVELLKSDERTVEKLSVLHGFQFSYSPIEPLVTLDYDIALNRNFDAALSEWGYHNGHSVSDFMKYRIFKLDPLWKKYLISYGENSRSQNASISIDPQFFDWLTHTGNYRAGYQHHPRSLYQRPGYLSTGVNSSFDFTSGFRIRSLISNISENVDTAKGLSRFFGAIEKGLDKIDLNSFNFSYNSSLDLKNDYFSTDYLSGKNIYLWNFFKYQLGLKGRNLGDIIRGDMDDKKAFGGIRSRMYLDNIFYQNDKRITNQELSINTSMRLPEPVDIQLNPISLGWSRKYNRIPDSTHLDSTFVYPDLRIGVSSNVLMKIPFIRQNMEKCGLSSTFRLIKTDKMSYYNRIDTILAHDEKLSHSWDPLINLDGKLKKWPVFYDYRHSYTSTKEKRYNDPSIDTTTEKTGNTTKEHKNIWTAKYTIPGRSDREANLFNRWTISLKGDFVLSLNVNYNISETIFDDEQHLPEKNWNLLIHPKMTYTFTDYVDGVLEYIYDKNYTSEDEKMLTNNTLSLTIRFSLK